MRIEIEGQVPIVIGKRVLVGQIIGAAVSVGAWIADVGWDFTVPPAVVLQIATLVTGLVQVYVVNKFGVTT